jgi:CDP-diacylglycerol--glycerol-3-phosphate 3-phosphatidyltransferase
MDSRLTILPEPLKNFVLGGLDPVADRFVRMGLRPNLLTAISVFVLLAASACYAVAELRWGAVLLLASGVLDLLDGKVARRGGMATQFGAFIDSTMDRLGEGMLFTGLAVYLIHTSGQRWPVVGLLLCFGTLTASFLVSYTRARAEGLGLDGRVGIATRAERLVLLAGPTLFFGAGPHGWLLLGILSFLFVSSVITVLQRIAAVHRQTHEPHHEAARAPGATPVVPAAVLKGS